MKKSVTPFVQTHFLNVDLDIRVKAGLKPLIEAFGRGAHCVHQSRTFAVLELNKQTTTVEANVMGFLKLITGLPPSARRIWQSCSLRSMNIGIQSGMEPNSAEFKISNKALKAATDCGVQLIFTVYAPEKISKRSARNA